MAPRKPLAGKSARGFLFIWVGTLPLRGPKPEQPSGATELSTVADKRR